MKRRIKNDIEMFDVDAQLDAAFGKEGSPEQKYHKFPMIVMDCREFFVPLRAILNYDTEKYSQEDTGKN